MPLHRILLDLEDVLINPLIAVRDIHFISSLIVAGIVFFDLFIASPVLRMGDMRLPATKSCFCDRTIKLLWISLALSIVSALAWLCLLSARLGGKPLADFFEQLGREVFGDRRSELAPVTNDPRIV